MGKEKKLYGNTGTLLPPKIFKVRMTTEQLFNEKFRDGIDNNYFKQGYDSGLDSFFISNDIDIKQMIEKPKISDEEIEEYKTHTKIVDWLEKELLNLYNNKELPREWSNNGTGSCNPYCDKFWHDYFWFIENKRRDLYKNYIYKYRNVGEEISSRSNCKAIGEKDYVSILRRIDENTFEYEQKYA